MAERAGLEQEAEERAVTRRPGLGGRLAGKSLPGQVFTLAIWPFLEQLLGFCVGMADTVFAGRLPGDVDRVVALDALALGGYFGWFVMVVLAAVSTGAAALVSRAVGAGDQVLARRAFGQALLLGALAGGVTMVVLVLGREGLVRLFGLGGETARLGSIYLLALGLSAPFHGVLFAANAALRGAGDTRTPFFVMGTVNLVNIGLSYVFVYGPGDLGGHGLAGVAAGTALAWVTGAILIVARVMGGGLGDELGGRLGGIELRPHLGTQRRLMRVGVPAGVEMAGVWILQAMVFNMITRLPGEGVMGAHMLAVRVESISFLPGFAIGTAAATLVGQYLGLGDKMRARHAVALCWAASALFMGLFGLLFFFLPETLVRLVVPDSPAVQELATPLVWLAAFFQPFLATTIVLKTAMRGAGDTRAVMLYSYLSMIVFRLVGCYVLGYVIMGELWWIWVAMWMDVIAQAVIFALRYRGDSWLKARV